MEKFKLVKEEIPTFTLQLKTLEGAWVKIKRYMPVGEARKLDLQKEDKVALGIEMMQECIVEWNIVGQDDKILPIDRESVDLIPLSDFNDIITVVQKVIIHGHYEEEKKA